MTRSRNRAASSCHWAHSGMTGSMESLFTQRFSPEGVEGAIGKPPPRLRRGETSCVPAFPAASRWCCVFFLRGRKNQRAPEGGVIILPRRCRPLLDFPPLLQTTGRIDGIGASNASQGRRFGFHWRARRGRWQLGCRRAVGLPYGAVWERWWLRRLGEGSRGGRRVRFPCKAKKQAMLTYFARKNRAAERSSRPGQHITTEGNMHRFRVAARLSRAVTPA